MDTMYILCYRLRQAVRRDPETAHFPQKSKEQSCLSSHKSAEHTVGPPRLLEHCFLLAAHPVAVRRGDGLRMRRPLTRVTLSARARALCAARQRRKQSSLTLATDRRRSSAERSTFPRVKVVPSDLVVGRSSLLPVDAVISATCDHHPPPPTKHHR